LTRIFEVLKAFQKRPIVSATLTASLKEIYDKGGLVFYFYVKMSKSPTPRLETQRRNHSNPKQTISRSFLPSTTEFVTAASGTQPLGSTMMPHPKDLLLNFATILLFSLPFLLYFEPMDTTSKQWGAYVTIACAFAYLYPPVTWKRPNEHSDDPHLKRRK